MVDGETRHAETAKGKKIYLFSVEPSPSVWQRANLHALRKNNELNRSGEESEYLKHCLLLWPLY